jgi:hypothetical protein
MMDVSREEELRMGLAAFHVIKQLNRDKILPEDHEVPALRCTHRTNTLQLRLTVSCATARHCVTLHIRQLVIAVKRIGRKIIEQTDLQGLHWEFVVRAHTWRASMLP